MFLYNNKAHNSCIKPFKLGLNGWGKPLLQVFNAKYYVCRICLHTQCENTAKNLLSTALSFLILRLGGNILEIFKFYKYSKYSLKKMMGEKCELHMDKRLCIKNAIVRCQTWRFLKSKHSGFNCNSSFFYVNVAGAKYHNEFWWKGWRKVAPLTFTVKMHEHFS